MSSDTAPEKTSPEQENSRPPTWETAPSEERGDEFTFPRGVGVLGMFLALVGALMMFYQIASNQPVRVGFLLMVGLGLAMMLYHAARDAELQIRRAYGTFGAALLVLGALFALLPGGPEGQREMGYRFLSLGFPSLVVGWLFVVSFLKHEEDVQYQRWTLTLLLALGALFSVGTFITGCIKPDFMAGTGLLMSLLGLGFLCSYIFHVGPESDRGYQVARGMGAVGLLVALYAIGRSAIPDLFGWDEVTPFLVPAGLILIGLGVIYIATSVALSTENQLVVMTRRELTTYFYSPIAYLVLFGLSLVGWVNYLLFLGELLEAGIVPEPIVARYVFRLEPVFAVLFVVPAITMRLLSEEKRTGTLEVLMTAPVKEWTVVLSKFFASLIFFLFLFLPWGLYLVALRSETGTPFDYRPLLSFYVVLVATGASFLSMGLFFSSLTRSQIIAGVLTFCVMFLYFLFYFFTGEVRGSSEVIGEKWRAVFLKLAFLHQWRSSLGGKLLLRDLILQLSLATFWLFLTVKVLESRKWK